MKKVIVITLAVLVSILTSCTDFLTFQEQIGNIQHKVIFDSQEAEIEASPAIKSITYPSTTIDALPENPVKSGFAFGGWFTLANGEGSEFTVSTPVTQTITVYAKWIVDVFTLSYETGAGSKIESVSVQNGAKAEKPIDPVLEGYTFGGWYTGEDYTTAWDFTVNTVTKDTTLYAKWIIKTYTITFVTNGGTEVSAITVNHGEKAIQSASPTRTGYGFDGWFTDEALSKAFDFTKDTVTANITLYAKWKLGSYTIQYNLNGGENSLANPLNYTTETETIKLASPTKTGYTFSGWFDNASFTGTAVTEIAKGSSGDKAIWAKWTVITYTITYNTNGGTLSGTYPTTYTVETETISLPEPEKTGYTFSGWFDNAGCTGSVVTSITKGSTGNIEYWAKFLITYTITYNTNGGTLSGTYPTTYTVETDTITLPIPEKDGYTFVSWFNNSGFTGSAVTSITKGSTGDKEYWAKWVTAYSIIYHANDGSGNTASQITGHGIPTNLNPNVFIRTDYIFSGWAESADGNPVYANKGLISSDTADEIHLFAKWLPLAEFTYTTNGNTIIITDYTGTDTVLFIPDEIDGMPVVSLGSNAFRGCTGLTSITISDGVTSIGNEAFYGCTGLTAIEIPDSVTSISNSAFRNCTGLTAITIPDSVTSIGNDAFYNCTGLTAIEIPEGVTSIGELAFRGCTGLTSITISDGVTSIGTKLFTAVQD